MRINSNLFCGNFQDLLSQDVIPTAIRKLGTNWKLCLGRVDI